MAPSGSFSQVSASSGHSCGLRSDGSLVCWGDNRWGQAVAPSGSFSQVSAGIVHSCGLRSDGSLVCWDYNSSGQAVAPSGSFSQVSAGRGHSCGLRSDGSLVCWGSNRWGQAVAPSGSFSQVSAGGDYSCGLRSDGSLVCWDYNSLGQAVAPSGSFSQVSASSGYSCGLRSDGSLVCWGDNSLGQAVAPSGSFSQVSAGLIHSCGLRSDGSLVCWGDNRWGQAVAPSGSFSQVSAGIFHSCGLRSDGSLVCWGDNSLGQAVAPSGSFSQVSAGGDYSCGLRSDGSLVCWGDNSLGQAVAPSGSFSQVSAGDDYSCGLRSDGSLVCWGDNRWGQAVAPSGSFSQVSAGDDHSCGLRSDGSLVCWGAGAVFLPAVAGGGDGSEPAESVAVPGKVARPSVSVGDGSLGVSWDAPSDGGSPIVDYDVRHVESGDIGCVDCGPLPWVDWEPSAVSASRRATITGLANGTSYAVVVRARNSVGVGEWSDDEWGTPVASVTAPGAPRDVAVAAHGERQLRVSWSAPAGGGSAVDHYRVRFGRGPLRGHPIHGDRDRWLSRVFVVRDTVAYSPVLRVGVAYAVTVTAVSAAGVQGQPTSATGIIAAPTELTAPRDVTAVAHGENGLRVSWSAPASTGGSAIDHYLVKYNRTRSIFGIYDGERTARKVDGTVATYPKLLAGSSYRVSVTAVNTAGRHSPAAMVTYWPPTPETPPETPAEKPSKLGKAEITNMEQLTGSLIFGFVDHADVVRIEWNKVSGATGYQVAYWFRQPYGETLSEEERHPDFITVEVLAKRGELVCERGRHRDNRIDDDLPCGVTSKTVDGADTTEYETKQLPEAKIPALMEVAVRAVNEDTDTEGEWSDYYSLPARKCQTTTIDLGAVGMAANLAEVADAMGLGSREFRTLVKSVGLAQTTLSVIDSMLNKCSSFKAAVADAIIDSVPFLRELFDAITKAFADTKCKDRNSDLYNRIDELHEGINNGRHPASEPYILCGVLYDIDNAKDKNPPTYRIN